VYTACIRRVSGQVMDWGARGAREAPPTLVNHNSFVVVGFRCWEFFLAAANSVLLYRFTCEALRGRREVVDTLPKRSV
jgi:hypothetical protein